MSGAIPNQTCWKLSNAAKQYQKKDLLKLFKCRVRTWYVQVTCSKLLSYKLQSHTVNEYLLTYEVNNIKPYTSSSGYIAKHVTMWMMSNHTTKSPNHYPLFWSEQYQNVQPQKISCRVIRCTISNCILKLAWLPCFRHLTLYLNIVYQAIHKESWWSATILANGTAFVSVMIR